MSSSATLRKNPALLTLIALPQRHRYEHPDFDPWLDKQQNRKTKTLLVGPVIDEDGKTAAVVTLWNKKPDPATGAPRTFTENDVKLMKMLTTHIAAFLRHV